MAKQENLVVEQGRTFQRAVRWETTPIVYKAITAIAQTAPATLTVPTHGIPDGWLAAVIDVKGMTEINAGNTPPKDSDFMRTTVVDANTVQFNEISSASFKPYRSGGFVMYYTPVSITGYVARMTLRDKIGGEALHTMTSSPANGITLDASGRTISLTIPAVTTAAFTWTKGVYDLELESPGGVVTALLYGSISVTKEVTT